MEEVERLATNTDPMLACCLCRCFLREAVQLTCLHNCCRHCFDTTASNGDSQYVACGVCGAITHGGTEQPNGFIDEQVRRYRSIAESKMCGVCNVNGETDKPALLWCSTCRHSLCGDCIAGHRQYFRQHLTQSLDELSSLEGLCTQQSASACPIHRKPLDIACLNCEQAKCIACWASCNENKHEMYIVGEESFDRYVDKFIASITSMDSELLRKSEVLEKPKSIINNMKKARDLHLEQIDRRKRRIVDAVEMTYQAIMTATRTAYDELEADGDAAAEAAARIDCVLSDARNYIRRLVESNDKCAILNQQKNVRKRLDVLSAELDTLSNRLSATMREMKLDTSLPEDLEEVLRAWIGMPRLYSVPSPSALPKQQVFSFGVARANFRLPVECYDVALTQGGRRLLLAANEYGLLELCSTAGRELSRWRPPKLSGKDDLVQGVSALTERQVAVGLLLSKVVVLLRPFETSGGVEGAAVGGSWIEDRRLDQLSWPPRRLSAHGDVLAITEDRKDEKQKRWLPGSRLQLMCVSNGRRLSGERQREYSIRDLAIAAKVVITGSLGKVKLGGSRPESRVLDAHSLTDGDERLWRYVLGSSIDEITYGICADSSGGCLYAAVLRSDLSGGRVSALSLADGSELRRVVLSFDGPHLLPVLLSVCDDASMDQSEQSISTWSSCHHSRTLLLAALCWDPSSKQQRTVTLHRSECDEVRLA